MSSTSLTSDKPPCECTKVRKAAIEFFAQLQTFIYRQPTDSKSAAKPTDLGASDILLSPLLTVTEAAVVANRTPSAIRHMIFQAEAHAELDDEAMTADFRNCIVRPPRSRRVFLHRERLMKLIDSWSTSSAGSIMTLSESQK